MAGERMTARNRSFLANRREAPGERRSLLGAATPLKLADKSEARRVRVLRQGWQEDALSYVDAIPELSFAYRFMQNSSARMRWFPAIVNPDDPGGPPIPIHDAPGVPSSVTDVCDEAMSQLGSAGRGALSPIQQSLSYNLGVPGECFIVGMQDDAPGAPQDWTVRSIDEFVVYEDTYKLREVPLDPQGILGWIDIDPAKTYACRVWNPHPRFQKLATSPMRALLDVAEELLLLSRDVRATARSRLAGAGILKVPEGLRMMSFLEDNEDALSDDWFGRFAELMMTPIADEGVASAVVPIAISGEPESLAQLDHLLLDRPFSALALELRAEAIGRIATGIDVPREVLEGMSDPNHWGAWLVSDDTFRHHLEPQVITQVDCFSIGYQRPWLQAARLPAYWLDRVCIWYDPVELITKPDPAENAILAHDRMVISNRALCEALGFDEEDMPDALEMEVRMITKLRSFPPNVLEALIHALDPALEIPPIEQSGQVPGMGPKGAIPATPIIKPGEPPPVPTGGAPGPPTPALPGAPTQATPPAPPPGNALPQAATAEPVAMAAAPRASADQERLSRKLSEIDRDLRTRLHQAACASVMRMLDRAGAKLRTRAKDRRFTAKIDAAAKERIVPLDVTNRRVAAMLSQPVVAALGYADTRALLDPNWEELQAQFVTWVKAAQQVAVKTACQLANVDPKSGAAQAARTKMEAAIPAAWLSLEAELDAIGEKLLYDPSPNADAEVNVDPNTVVPVGVVRRALAVAGGAAPAKGTVIKAADEPDDGGGLAVEQVDPGGGSNLDTPAGAGGAMIEVPGQVGTGDAIGDLLDSADLVPVGYSWVHGPTLRPFEPHEDLDGEDFASFDDDVLANPGDFPETPYYFPGDHDGCSCDFTTTWGTAEEAAAAAGEDTGGAADEGVVAEETDAETAGLDISDLRQAVSEMTGEAGPASRAAAQRDLADARASIMDDVAQAKANAEATLDRMGVRDLARPPKGDTSAEYDWYRQLSGAEQDRLRNNGWLTAESTITPDVAGQGAFTGAEHMSTDQAMKQWLDATRTVDASNLIEGGRGLSANAIERLGGFNLDNLAPTSPYNVEQLFASWSTHAADYLAGARSEAAAEMVERELGANLGSPIYNMDFSAYSDEVAALEAQLESASPIATDAEWGDTYDAATQQALSRLDELLPAALVSPEAMPAAEDLYSIWSEAVQIAKLAGLGE